MKILLYGGSFNPVHKAHVENVRLALDAIAFDKVIIIPNKVGHFKENIEMANDKDRITMLEIAFKDIEEDIEISNIEIEANEKMYTTHLVDEIKKEYKDSQLYFLIGSDQAMLLDKWYDIENLKQKVNFIVTKREDDYIEEDLFIIDNIALPDSSTSIRKDYQSTGIDSVDKYIRNHGLYLQEYVYTHLSKARAQHTIRVAKLAKKLALHYSIDETKAYIAAMLHDIAKELPLEEQFKLVGDCSDLFEASNPTIHQYSACNYIKEVMSINDDEVESAICKHTTGNFEMSKLDKIIYCADMLEENRTFKDIDKLRSLLYIDIDECFKQCFIKSYDFLVSKGIYIDSKLKKLKEKVERNEV
ncbi:MAG: nicotinate (nicotinamide) nucleotide adenylyltransferase [Erysipelotrichales bacterium]